MKERGAFGVEVEAWNFAAWIAAIHAAVQAFALVFGAYAARKGMDGAAAALSLLDAVLTFPFVPLWNAAGLGKHEALFFLPRVPAAILWGVAAAKGRGL